MVNFDYITKKGHNPNWPQIPYYPYRTLIIGGSGYGETNALLNVVNYHPDTDIIYIYVRIHIKKIANF